MGQFNSIGIVARRHDGSPDRASADTLNAVLHCLRGFGKKVVLDASVLPYLPESATVERAQLAAQCDLAVVIGGDGTLLDAGRTLAPLGVPLVGVHAGKLGFMVDVQTDTLYESFTDIFSNQYLEEPRLMLQLVVEQDGQRSAPQVAVNDIVLTNQAGIRMVDFETWQGSTFISLHKADGFIVATPTGSTAYALSGGGPVMYPTLDAITLVPICPHALSDRPLVMSAKEPVRVVVKGDSRTEALVTCDGQIHTRLSPGAQLHISKADKSMRLIHPRRYDYFRILRDKLRWGRGPDPISAS